MRDDLQVGGQSGGRLRVQLSKMELERVYEFLRRQADGLAKLTEIVRKDFRDLDIMRMRSRIESENAARSAQRTNKKL